MKKYIYTALYFVVAFVFVANFSKAQTPQQNLDKYWHYRYRFDQYFEKIGMKQGESCPATIRNGGGGGLDAKLYWGDGPLTLGHYIGVLATEYKLLADNHQDVNETVRELYYTLHTVYRLDSMGYVRYGKPAPPYPGQGFMIRDDVPANFVSLYGASLNLATYPPTSGYVNTGNGQPCPITDVDAEFQSGAGDLGIDAGIDVYSSLLMGLDLVIALVPDQNIPFTETDNSSGNTINYMTGAMYPQNKTLHQMAFQLGSRILNYIKEIHPVMKPETYTVNFPWWLGGPMTYTIYVEVQLPYVLTDPGGNIVPLGDGGFPSPATLSIPLNAQSSNFYSMSMTISIPESFAWNDYFDLCSGSLPSTGTSTPGAYCDNTNNVIAIVNATTSNIGAINFPYSTDLINFLGGDNQCLECGGQKYYGRNIYYSGIQDVLYDKPASVWDFCEANDILNTAPYDGPFYHVPSDFAPGGWACDRRFVDGNGQQVGQNNPFPGNFSGLDYMLLFNIYNLMVEKANNFAAIQVPKNAIANNHYVGYHPNNNDLIPEEYPFQYSIIPNYSTYYLGGTVGSPYPISTSFCNQSIVVSKLNVDNGGGLVLNPGTDAYADLNPTQGPILISQGGYCDIAPNSTCCSPSTTYNNDFPFFNPSTLHEIKPYVEPSEFDSLSLHSSIYNYPNPFTNETNIVFLLKKSDIVSLYITDLSGQKITTLINSQQYNEGSNVVLFNSASLPAGNYICVLQTSDGTKTFKMIKTK